MRKIATIAYLPLGIRTVRSTSEELGLVTSVEGEGEEGGEVNKQF
jgi:hypothetical protein